MVNWDPLVEERSAWVAHNFPDSPEPLTSVLGCIEECGELTHHHLKQAQSIRGDALFHESEARDAVGDLTIYLLGVMSHSDTRPEETAVYAEETLTPDSALLRLAYWVGILAHFQLFRGTQLWAVTHIVANLQRYCKARGWDYDQIAQETWDHVRQRDWIKYPQNGMTE